MSHKKPANVRWIGALALAALLILAVAGIATATGPVGTAAGFEDDDGNMTSGPVTDWNSFSPLTWVGTAPYREADKVFDGWTFKGIEDAVVTTSDSAFAGGTKQDDDCATLITNKAPNKDDLQRVYLASKVVAGKTYLMLAWHRIPQNTTSPSAHIGFEFNKGTAGACGGGSGELMKRVAGDMLIVYDFEGGSTDTPTITLRRWVTSGACEVGSSNPPCWGTAVNLTAAGYAEARVNTFGAISDLLSPSQPDNVGTNEFGEAGINLTDAGVFAAGTCESFGSAFAVSRSSGNSGTAQMKDIDGPADFTIANCGTVITRKVTVPSGDATTSFSYTTNVTNNPNTTPSPFSLKDGEHNDIFNVVPGSSLNVTEGNPAPNYQLTGINCSASSVPAANIQTSVANRAVTFSITAGQILDCTFTNTLQRGAIEVTKTRKHAASGSGNWPHAGVSFTVNGVTQQTGANGKTCFDGLPFGSYNVVETVPAGYVGEGGSTTTVTKSVTVDNNAQCTDNPYGGETVSFANMPLTNITFSVNSQVDGGTASTFACIDVTTSATIASGSTGANGDGSVSANNLVPGIYRCTVIIDP